MVLKCVIISLQLYLQLTIRLYWHKLISFYNLLALSEFMLFTNSWYIVFKIKKLTQKKISWDISLNECTFKFEYNLILRLNSFEYKLCESEYHTSFKT